MKLLSRLFSAFGLAVLAAAGFAATAWLIGMERISWFDSAIIPVVQGWERPGLTSLMEGLTWFGRTVPTTVFSFLIMAFLFFVLRHRWELLLFVVVMIGSTLLNKIMKELFGRERPDIHRLAEEAGYSFPSGHAMASFALYGILTYLLWRHITSGAGRTVLVAVCALMFLGIGTSRIYLGVHYPSDVLGGYLASGAWLGLSIGAYERWSRKRRAAGRRAS
ncbi:phosphatase PAP2 family protein [Cohnella sp. CFH 77786]|uniref:phosphatase PAP2 family protein n=1 Tax=Cohnella sp. CFH 77786 TaxID=2662265 RepID=UPI001C610D4B|nr:phosphatase PAP2 family protein [Cohnella sp. CFH 77786]MBW5447013.1 phosphatase PAP2 family protein [Cohnella sp. CFH 77786]